MNFLNVGSRHTAQTTSWSPLRLASQKLSNLFNSRPATPFGTTLQELEASQGEAETAGAMGLTRQNFVAGPSNSRTTGAHSASVATSPGRLSPAAAASNNEPGESASTGIIEQIIAREQGFAGKAASQNTSPSAPASSAVKPAAPPTPYVPSQLPSDDPGVYSTMSYSEGINLSGYEVQANDENARRYQNYMNEFQNWQLNGSQGQPPQPPVYETVDQNGFAQWWGEYQQNMLSGNYDAPDVSMFLSNAPDYGNGYYGAPGTSQVGTLYNPTGPATAQQIQAAKNLPGASSTSNPVNS